jgi:hypothetical protein
MLRFFEKTLWNKVKFDLASRISSGIRCSANSPTGPNQLASMASSAVTV